MKQRNEDKEARYGLEQHLRMFSETDQAGAMLYSYWVVEKKKLSKKLKAVPQAYPHYSMHDASHSETILSCVELFLGEPRIHALSATDTWLLLQCAYSHDLGMIISAKDLVEKLTMEDEEGFQYWAKQFREQSYEVSQAFSEIEPLLLLKRRNRFGDYSPPEQQSIITPANPYINVTAVQMDNLFEEDWHEWPMQLVRAFTILSEAYNRPKHHLQSFMAIESEGKSPKNEDDVIPLRLRLLIATISRLHGEERKTIVDLLPHSTVGYCGDYAHPRFIALLLRVGDLLDLEDNRFNKSQLSIIGNNSYSSLVHQIKHLALRHLLITDSEIEVSANFEHDQVRQVVIEADSLRVFGELCSNSDVENKVLELCMRGCRALLGWLNMLEAELHYFNDQWQSCVPKVMMGACPQLKKKEIRIDGALIDEDILELRYAINTKRAAEIIEGSGLYARPHLVFLRELIQNAMDASKIQLFRDIKNGIYPQVFDPTEQDVKEIKNLSPMKLLEDMHDVRTRYRIEICCREVDMPKRSERSKDIGRKNVLRISVRDRGIGIPYEQLQ